MNQEQLLAHIKGTFDECMVIVKKKNSDYSQSSIDAFSNFRHAQLVGVTAERAILVRVTDKMARLSNILEKNSTAVSDETVADTINDIINYMAILKAMLK